MTTEELLFFGPISGALGMYDALRARLPDLSAPGRLGEALGRVRITCGFALAK